MKRITHLLLLVAVLVPFCRTACGETMEERKQRIMRKYLRERQTIVQSDMILPEPAEDERITDSEKFKQVKMDISRRQATTPSPAPIVRPIPVQARRSWLLEEEDADADPYADPFAMDSGQDREEGEVDWWSEWKSREEAMAADNQLEAARTYDYLRDAGYSVGGEGQTRYGYTWQQDQSSRYPYGRAPQTSYGQQSDNGLGSFGTTRYGSSPSTGMPQLSTPLQGTDDSSSSRKSGYTPYKSPYQSQRQQQQQQTYPQTQDQQEYTRPTPYQQWKDNKKEWDPTADDAYLDELMQRSRR